MDDYEISKSIALSKEDKKYKVSHFPLRISICQPKESMLITGIEVPNSTEIREMISRFLLWHT